MGSMNTAGWLVMGIILVVLGFLIRSDIISAILEVIGWIIIILGIVIIVFGLFGAITGRRRSGGF